MKTIISMMALLISLNAGGLMGFKFGDSVSNVDKILIAKGAVKQNIPQPSAIVYKIKTFAGLNCDMLVLLYNDNNQVVKAAVYTEEDYETTAFSEYMKLKGALTKKYGTPKNDEYFYKSPYTMGDGYTYTAFRNKKGIKYTIWKPEGMNIAIQMKAGSYNKFNIDISYEDTKLFKAFIESQKEKSSEDL